MLILAYRKRLDFSQEELAGRAHIAPITVGRIERGEFRVTLEHAEAIAAACQVPLWQVLKDIAEHKG
ncbi:helix-turn-helix domain-containing protein [Deinococcus altitudinis]|uniref:helix-turn-helix domain-containing protein n=1 Tax=Deinococcus altitudinis TaxID=468914 RepID=UPI003891D73D